MAEPVALAKAPAALAQEAGGVLGLDVSSGMVEAAPARGAGIPGLSSETCCGHGLAEQPGAGFDLLLPNDVRHVAEAARILRPGGRLAVLNLSHRGAKADRADLARVAGNAGFTLPRNSVRELVLWDGPALWLHRP